jgi:hypothetical protein
MCQHVKVTQTAPNYFSYNWRRITLLFTTGDRFEAATELGDLFKDESASGYPFVILKEC